MDRLNLPMDKTFVNIDKYGNTSSASIPIAMDEARKAGRLKKGDILLLVAIGGGLTWGFRLLDGKQKSRAPFPRTGNPIRGDGKGFLRNI